MANIMGGEKGKSILVAFLEKVKDFITSEVMEKNVVDALIEKELSKRSAAFVICFENLQKLASDLNKINRPDIKTYAGTEGTAVHESYSETRMNEIKKLREKIDKYERSLDKALKGDMKDVYDLNQQSSSKDKGSGGGKSSEGDAKETS
jgi:hypothetical protein